MMKVRWGVGGNPNHRGHIHRGLILRIERHDFPSVDPVPSVVKPLTFMRIAYLDCFSGISGDMFMGALLDAGVSRQLFEDAVEALDIGARLEISQVTRGGISATKVDVYVNG